MFFSRRYTSHCARWWAVWTNMFIIIWRPFTSGRPFQSTLRVLAICSGVIFGFGPLGEWRLGSGELRKPVDLRARNVDHLLAEAHLFGIGLEVVVLGGHFFSDLQLTPPNSSLRRPFRRFRPVR